VHPYYPGRVAVAGDVAAICSTLRETYPAAIIVLSGITLRHPDTGQRALLDLVAITLESFQRGGLYGVVPGISHKLAITGHTNPG